MIEKIKYAIFDIDGTLVDSLGYWEYLWGRFGTEFLNTPDFEVDTELDRKIRTVTLAEGSLLIKQRYLLDCSAETIMEFANEILGEYYRVKVSAKRGAPELLNYLKSKGIKMCVASATEPKYIKYSLERCGLDGFFEFVISCTEVGAGKEKPDVFIKALSRLGGEVSEACVFEDSCVALETAKRAGFMTVGVYDKNNYGHDRLESASDVYVNENMNLSDLIK